MRHLYNINKWMSQVVPVRASDIMNGEISSPLDGRSPKASISIIFIEESSIQMFSQCVLAKIAVTGIRLFIIDQKNYPWILEAGFRCHGHTGAHDSVSYKIITYWTIAGWPAIYGCTKTNQWHGHWESTISVLAIQRRSCLWSKRHFLAVYTLSMMRK